MRSPGIDRIQGQDSHLWTMCNAAAARGLESHTEGLRGPGEAAGPFGSGVLRGHSQEHPWLATCLEMTWAAAPVWTCCWGYPEHAFSRMPTYRTSISDKKHDRNVFSKLNNLIFIPPQFSLESLYSCIIKKIYKGNVTFMSDAYVCLYFIFKNFESTFDHHEKVKRPAI
ncbi:hypothetical protein H1C71_035536 [Ictidomys tridecemlineatus]|nr:hypothetical protein H1C71_035536 [Ictidomys tridecemlineatus]